MGPRKAKSGFFDHKTGQAGPVMEMKEEPAFFKLNIAGIKSDGYHFFKSPGSFRGGGISFIFGARK